MAKHHSRTFVAAVDFITTLGFGRDGTGRNGLEHIGKGPTKVITDLCVMMPDADTKELMVMSLHPGVSREQVEAATGWSVKFHPELTVTAAPTEVELQVLRALKHNTAVAHAS